MSFMSSAFSLGERHAGRSEILRQALGRDLHIRSACNAFQHLVRKLHAFKCFLGHTVLLPSVSNLFASKSDVGASGLEKRSIW